MQQPLDANLQNSGWQKEVPECNHEMAYLKILGTQSGAFNNGLSLACRLCGQRWQRLLLTRPDTSLSVQGGSYLKSYERGIRLPLLPGNPWSEQAVNHRLRLECAIAVARVEHPRFWLQSTTFSHHVICRQWQAQPFREAIACGRDENPWPFHVVGRHGSQNPTAGFDRELYVPRVPES